MISDDCFIIQTLDHWNVGLDNTGFLMDINNMLHVVTEAAEMGDMLLVTVDGDTTAGRILVSRNQLHHTFTTVFLYTR
jgi:hypothetical protein